MYAPFGLFIAGEWRGSVSGATAPVFSPVTELSLGDCPVATEADTAAAIDAAQAGLAAWSATPAFTRADAMHRIADEMLRRTDEAARMISLETGKPIAQSGREWGLCIDQFRWYAEEARRIYGRIIESRVPGGRFEIHRGDRRRLYRLELSRSPDCTQGRSRLGCGLFHHRPPFVPDTGRGDGDG